jgi:hypothetical protein
MTIYKTIVAYYVNVGNATGDDVIKELEFFKDQVKPDETEPNIKHIFYPVRSTLVHPIQTINYEIQLPVSPSL